MGFLKNIFKRKEGGTKLGNLLRGTSSALTGGILGSGQGLANWEREQAKKAQKDYENNLRMLQMPQTIPSVSGYGKAVDMRQVGQDFVNGTIVPTLTNGNGQSSPMIGQSVFYATLKKNWLQLLIAGTVLGGAVYYFATKNRKPKNKF